MGHLIPMAERLGYQISRRHFSVCLGRVAFASTAISVLGISSRLALAESAVGTAPSKAETETLVQYAHFVLPVLAPNHARYRAVADKISAQAAQIPPIASMMADGIAALNDSGKGPWLQLPLPDKTKLMGSLEGTPFFGFLRWTTSEIVMRDPVLWEKLGYQGSAIEHGGYLHRGFDDIDWLPRANRKD